MTTVIKTDRLSKCFKIGTRERLTLFTSLRYKITGTLPSRELWALKDISFSVKKGEMTAVIGHNGAGKTTLINIFVGILKPNGGEIYMDGTNIRNMGREFLAQIGYMPQYPVFYKDFEVLKFLNYKLIL